MSSIFLTPIEIPKSKKEIDHKQKIITLGSCFSDNIGKRLKENYFDTLTNPFGVLYNPISIKKSIEILIEKKEFGNNDILEHNGLYHSFSHSSIFSNSNKDVLLKEINRSIIETSSFLQNTDILIVTFGTAWIFEDKENNKSVVSNCHKLPAKRFSRRRLSIEEIIIEWSKLIERLKIEFPKLNLIFTVSPIRHWKDGATENMLSKSTLHLAIDKLTKEFENCQYFPAYQIVMDELRDYRFYSSDMIHLSEVAVDYIWNKFSQTYFTNETNSLNSRLLKYRKSINHRILNAQSAEAIKFEQSITIERERLQNSYPFLIDRL